MTGGLWAVISAIVVALWAVAFRVGYLKGKADERAHQKKLDEYAEWTREKITEEIRNLSDADLDSRLDKWLRDH